MAKCKNLKLPCIIPPLLHGKTQKSQIAMYYSTPFTWQISKGSNCHVLCHRFYMAKCKNLKLPCIISLDLHGKFQKSQIAMYYSTSFTWQNAKISKCHVLFHLFYMANFKRLKLPCTVSPLLHGKLQKSQIAMYYSTSFTWQNAKISNCHVLFHLFYMASCKNFKLPCTVPLIIPPDVHGKAFSYFRSRSPHSISDAGLPTSPWISQDSSLRCRLPYPGCASN